MLYKFQDSPFAAGLQDVQRVKRLMEGAVKEAEGIGRAAGGTVRVVEDVKVAEGVVKVTGERSGECSGRSCKDCLKVEGWLEEVQYVCGGRLGRGSGRSWRTAGGTLEWWKELYG